MDHDDPVLARVGASAPRRVFALAVLWGLALMLLWIGAVMPSGLPWRLVFLGLGTGALVAGLALWRATRAAIVLTEAGLFETGGRCLARIEEIRGVDRGMFAMKPSNGFLLRLARSPGRAWAPGLWWRWGRRLGVGGVTASAEARAMADILAIRLAEGAKRRG